LRNLAFDLAAGQGKAIEKALEVALSTSDQALLTDYVRRHARECDHGSDIKTGLPQLEGPEKPGDTNPCEKRR